MTLPTLGPDLASFRDATSSGSARWELVLVNSAGTPSMNKTHYSKMGLRGRLVRDGLGGTVHELFGIGGYQTPWIHVFDRSAVELATVSADGTSTSPADVLALLEQKVGQPGE